MEKGTNRKILIGTIIAIVVVILAQCAFYVHVYFEKKANHEKVVKLINEDLLFSWDSMDADLEYINNWISKGHLSNEDLGRLYERASLIYMQKGETMSYYRNLGYALYYLERSSEKDYTINVYLDLANFFLNNYAIDSAENMMEAAYRIKQFEDIEDLQIKSYAFRMKGIMAIQQEDFEKAEEYLTISQETINQSHTGIYEDSYTIINDAWFARVYYETGRYDECAEKLAKWEGHDIFYTDIYREIFLRDLIIPFYQVKCLLTTARAINDSDAVGEDAERIKEQQVFAAFEEFMALCEENGYQKTELNTVLKMQKDFPPVTEKSKEAMLDVLRRLYAELFDEQNLMYASVIDSMVTDSMSEMDKLEETRKNYLNRSRFAAISSIAIILVLINLALMVLNSRIDGLTRLFNRRAFNRTSSRLEKSESTYGIIMIDIDHFKNINDTYGHQKGDMVLERLGQLIHTERNADVHCFRYGGEEFVLTLERGAVSRAEAIAERIRSTAEHQRWSFDKDLVVTISAGIATGSKGVDVLKKADDNLYQSKESGRNRVTC